eukprot:GHVS01074445.1.p1 GENE.GHVS01074445.1~~GHVS01074445.1.p1  ORF type:complete len:374 (+),score=41.20 GHVS01074445.1:142-1263(+)
MDNNYDSVIHSLSVGDVVRYARGVPKCELHVHVEGTLESTLVEAIRSRQQRNDVVGGDLEKQQEQQKDNGGDGISRVVFGNLRSFLASYKSNLSVLIKEDDFFMLAWCYFKRAHKDNVRHAECFFDPQAHLARGIEFGCIVRGIRRAQQKAKYELNMSTKLIMCLLRDAEDMDSAWHCLNQAKVYRDDIIGVGLDSNEIGYPCSLFSDIFRAAKQAGFRLTAHAGEEGPVSNIWEAITDLHVDRIDHGFRCLEDPVLVQLLKDKQIPLTICPLSNINLGSFQSIKEHSIINPMIIQQTKLNISINSDDPAYFGGYINDNFDATIRGQSGWTIDLVKSVAENSVEGSFLSREEKDKLLEEIDCYHNKFTIQQQM